MNVLNFNLEKISWLCSTFMLFDYKLYILITCWCIWLYENTYFLLTEIIGKFTLKIFFVWNGRKPENINNFFFLGGLCWHAEGRPKICWAHLNPLWLSCFALQIFLLIVFMCITLLIASLICLTLPGMSSWCAEIDALYLSSLNLK